MGCAFVLPKNSKTASAAVPAGEIWKGKNFDGNALNDLFEVLIGQSGAKIKDVEAAVTEIDTATGNPTGKSSPKTAADFRTNNGGSDIVLTIAGKKWTPVYLSIVEDNRVVDANVKAGDAILTLLSLDTDLTSKFAAFGGTTNGTTPCSMYSTSYMRAEVLNNGGGYATSANDDFDNLPVQVTKKTTDDVANGGNTFAKFTSELCDGNLTKYIVKPQNIEFQATECAKTYWQYKSCLSNDAYEEITPWTGNGSAQNNYWGKKGYDDWKNDYLWLPSMAELGDGSTGANDGGIWKTSLNQRYQNNKGIWTRSAGSNNIDRMYGVATTYLDLNGLGTATSTVRPAFHLNLTAAAGIVLPTEVTVTYNGGSQTIADVSADQKDWYDSSLLSVSYVTPTMQNVGTYSMKLELTAAAIADDVKFCTDPDTSKGETDTIRYIDFKITPKTLNATLAESNGTVTLTVDSSGLCGTDSLPNMAIQYTSTDGAGYNSTNAPQQKGQFKAEPKITDANSNYTLSSTPASVTYTINSIKVSLPTLPPTAVPVYDGTSQDITLSGYTHNGKGVNIFSVTGKTASGQNVATAPTFDTTTGKVTFKDAGSYTITVTLEDATNCEWQTVGGNGRKEITFTVKPKQLTLSVSNDNSNLWSWGVGTAVNATVSLSDIVSGDNVTLTTVYSASTGADVKSTGTGNSGAETLSDSIALPAALVQGSYTLTAEIDNENYSIADGLAGAGMPLTFTIGAQVFDPDAFGWVYTENGATGTQPIADGDSFLKYKLDSAGNPYEYKLTISLGSFAGVFNTVTDTDYTDNKKKAAGSYTTKVKLTIRNTDYSFDTTKTYSHATILSTTEAEIFINWTVEKGDFTGLDTLPWMYKYGTGSWVDYNPARPPEFGNGTVTVKMKGDVEGTLKGLTFNYGGVNSERNKGDYTVRMSFGVTDTDNFNIPQGFNWDWKITKKQINVQWEQDVALTYTGTAHPEWQGNDYLATQLRYEKPEFADKVDYIYSCTLPDGSAYSGRGVEALAYITEQALSVQRKIEVTVQVELKSDASILNDYDLVDSTGGNYTTSFMVGDSKLIAKVNLTAEGEYGNFTYKAEVTGEDMDSGKYSVAVYKGNNLNDITDPDNILIENFDPNTADAGEYFIVVTLTGNWADEYRLSGGKKAFVIEPKKIAVPTLGEVIFTGSDISIADYLGGSWAEYKDIITLGGEYEGLRNVSENGYVATLTLNSGNYKWDYGAGNVTVRFTLADGSVTAEGTDSVANYKWNVSPLIVDTTNMWSKGKNGATLNLPASVKALIDGETLTVGYRYYDGATGEFLETPEIKGKKQFKVEAAFGGFDAENGNVVFRTGETTVGTVSPMIDYTVPQSGAAAVFGNAVSFFKSNWLWFLIALLVLLFLIILICIIAKRRKNKEERLAKKEAKEEEKRRKEEEREEEKRRKEEEREEEKRRREQELELEKAKQEAELAKMKAQMGLAGAGAGMAAMAMAQQPQMQQQMPQPQYNQAPPAQAQPPMPQQPYPQLQPQFDRSELAELRADIAELKAQQRMNNNYPQMPMMQMPMQMPVPQYNNNGGGGSNGNEVLITMLQNQLNEMRNGNSDKEIASLKTQLEIMKLKAEQGATPQAQALPQYAQTANANNSEIEKFGAFAASLWRNMNSARVPKEIPQSVEESKPVSVSYPPDAVVTTTTRVDTTKNGAPRSEDGRNFDIDGFYDTFEEGK